MSSHPIFMAIFMAIEPRSTETRLMLAASASPSALRARLPTTPAHSRALIALLEATSLWFGWTSSMQPRRVTRRPVCSLAGWRCRAEVD
ncbi:hypothetical protein BH09MYX1_BH09MYX1_52500 [soil metagenome]